jgi:cytochrome c556
MIRVTAVVAAIAIGATAVYAQNLDAVKKRRDVMKAIATAGTVNFNMMKGDVPFDLAKVQAGLKTYQDEAAKLPGLFPDDSKTGGDTDASPKIWQAKGDFDAAVNTFIATAKNAAGVITDEASFKKEYPPVFRSCGGCHKDDGGFAPRLADSFKKLKQ